MKRKLVATIGTLAAAAVLGLGFSQSGGVQAEPKFSTADIHKKVSEQYPGTIKELELAKESKKEVYEVEIEINGKEYELEVDGNTGEILNLDEKTVPPEENVVNTVSDKLIITEKKMDEDDNKKDDKAAKQDDKPAKKENKAAKQDNNTVKKESKPAKQYDNTAEKKSKPVQNEKPSNKQAANSSKQDNSKVNNEKVKKNKESAKIAVIGESKAKRIALSQFSGKVEEIELDKDDGRLIYEVEIENGNREAEIDIDAYTGAVLVLDIDTDDDDDD
ncbi:hypothetical protein CIL03_09185 [Virgibacillus indicus]|uniref:PepSY domain-containing protein n=1 Tax=Virgibacillus indicus TaxID=2024554 RepID=A0A265NAV3_9BACI|nr:PepSY domain-containing protein [Virgibacillus indicus]OZU89170.1 hypothetical protein CIL03_09185 [Virgibacillus indicus]